MNFYKLLFIFTLLPLSYAFSEPKPVCHSDLTKFELSIKNQLRVCRKKNRPPQKSINKKLYCHLLNPSNFQHCRPLNDFEHVTLGLFWNEYSNLGYSSEQTKILKAFSKLRTPLYFGGSITAESLNNPIWREAYSFVVRNTDISGVPRGQNPAKLAVQSVYQAYAQLNSGWDSPQSADNYLGNHTAPKFKTTVNNMGSRQVLAMLNNIPSSPSSERLLYKKSTAVIGLDGFYWDAAIGFNSCGYGKARYDLPRFPKLRTDVEWVIESLIKTTQKDGKFLLLATTPLDTVESSKVDNYDLKFDGYNNSGMGGYEIAEKPPLTQVWRPGVKDCVESINQTIRTHCEASESCKYLDFDELNTLLWNQQYDLLPPQFTGKDFYDFRPDGVHLSKWGSEKLSEIIFEKITGIALSPTN